MSYGWLQDSYGEPSLSLFVDIRFTLAEVDSDLRILHSG